MVPIGVVQRKKNSCHESSPWIITRQKKKKRVTLYSTYVKQLMCFTYCATWTIRIGCKRMEGPTPLKFRGVGRERIILVRKITVLFRSLFVDGALSKKYCYS